LPNKKNKHQLSIKALLNIKNRIEKYLLKIQVKAVSIQRNRLYHHHKAKVLIKFQI